MIEKPKDALFQKRINRIEKNVGFIQNIEKEKNEVFNKKSDVEKIVVSQEGEGKYLFSYVKEEVIDEVDYCGLELHVNAKEILNINSELDQKKKIENISTQKKLINEFNSQKIRPWNFFKNIVESEEKIDIFNNFEDSKKYLAETVFPKLYKFAMEKNIVFFEFSKELSEKIINCSNLKELLEFFLTMWTLEDAEFYKVINVLMFEDIKYESMHKLLKVPLMLFSLNFSQVYGEYNFSHPKVYRMEKKIKFQNENIGSKLKIKGFWCTSYNKEIKNNENFKYARNFIKIQVYPDERINISNGFFTNSCIEKYSSFPDEHEVLFLPFCEFHIEKIVVKNKRNHVKLLQNVTYDNMSQNFFILLKNNLLHDLQKNYWPDEKIKINHINLVVIEELYSGNLQNEKNEIEYLYLLGNNYLEMGLLEKAKDKYEELLKIQKRIYNEENEKIALTYNQLGIVYKTMERFSEALEYYEKALEIDKKIYGEQNINVAQRLFFLLYNFLFRLNNIGHVNKSLKKHFNAIKYYQKAKEITEKIKKGVHPDIATYLSNIGMIYQEISKYDLALSNFEKALEIEKKFNGEEHTNVAIKLNNIGGVYKEMEKYQEALEFYQKALEIDRNFHGDFHADVAIDLNNIGVALKLMDRNREALENIEKAFFIFENLYGNEHSYTKALKNNIQELKELE